jgi:Beige/BEACH domain
MNYYISDRRRDDRLPVDFKTTYDLVMSDKQANTELCPEHFYLPEIMANPNKLDLGTKDSERVIY